MLQTILLQTLLLLHIVGLFQLEREKWGRQKKMEMIYDFSMEYNSHYTQEIKPPFRTVLLFSIFGTRINQSKECKHALIINDNNGAASDEYLFYSSLCCYHPYQYHHSCHDTIFTFTFNNPQVKFS